MFLSGTCVVLFSYDDLPSLKRIVPKVLSSEVERVVVVCEGSSSLREYLTGLQDPRLHISYQAKRVGKARAYNRSLALLGGSSIVFLLSTDIDFDPSIFQEVLSRFDRPKTGVVVPKVLPLRSQGLSGHMGALLWAVHDTTLARLSSSGSRVHGGEFMAMRRELLVPLPEDVVNDDAYLCLYAESLGFALVDARECTVRNSLPHTLYGLFVQRRRVAFGHLQLVRQGKGPEILTLMVFGRTRALGRAGALLLDTAERYPFEMLWLPFLVLEEVVANLLARRDIRRSGDHSVWRTVSSVEPDSHTSTSRTKNP